MVIARIPCDGFHLHSPHPGGRHILVTTVIALSATGELLAQQPSPAEGPWSGQAQCVVVAKWADYLDEQTDTWRLTGAPPKTLARIPRNGTNRW